MIVNCSYTTIIGTHMTDCILHTGYTTQQGYGIVKREGKVWFAHRWAAHVAHGPCPPGQMTRHKCDVKACINPDHLIYGTSRDNQLDHRERGGVYRKLDIDDVEIIKARLDTGEILRTIAADFNVSIGCISKIKLGKQWAPIK